MENLDSFHIVFDEPLARFSNGEGGHMVISRCVPAPTRRLSIALHARDVDHLEGVFRDHLLPAFSALFKSHRLARLEEILICTEDEESFDIREDLEEAIISLARGIDSSYTFQVRFPPGNASLEPDEQD